MKVKQKSFDEYVVSVESFLCQADRNYKFISYVNTSKAVCLLTGLSTTTTTLSAQRRQMIGTKKNNSHVQNN